LRRDGAPRCSISCARGSASARQGGRFPDSASGVAVVERNVTPADRYHVAIKPRLATQPMPSAGRGDAAKYSQNHRRFCRQRVRTKGDGYEDRTIDPVRCATSLVIRCEPSGIARSDHCAHAAAVASPQAVKACAAA
jgi:hypothetical protein